MATRITTSSLTVSITEAITLNGVPQGSSTSKTFGSIGSIFKRIARIPETAEMTLYDTHDSNIGGSTFDVDLIKYTRITNLDDANAIDIVITSSSDDEVAYKLAAQESLVLYSHKGMLNAHNEAMTVNAGVQGSTAIMVDDGDQADSGQYTEGQYIKFIARDGTVGIFILADSSEDGAVTSGTVLTSTSDLGTTTPSASLLAQGTCIAVTTNLNTTTQNGVLNEIRDTVGSTNSPLLGKISGAAGTASGSGNQSITFTQAKYGAAGNTVTTTDIYELTAPDFTSGVDGGIASKLDISTITAIANTDPVDVEIFIASGI
jgi:hypothetical protein